MTLPHLAAERSHAQSPRESLTTVSMSEASFRPLLGRTSSSSTLAPRGGFGGSTGGIGVAGAGTLTPRRLPPTITEYEAELEATQALLEGVERGEESGDESPREEGRAAGARRAIRKGMGRV